VSPQSAQIDEVMKVNRIWCDGGLTVRVPKEADAALDLQVSWPTPGVAR
jgi:hypothetical protein